MAANLEEILNNFTEFTRRPEQYLSAQNDNALELMKSTKSLYDFTKTEDIERDSSDALPELIIDGFDDEQVWQEIELQNDPVISSLLQKMSRLAASSTVSLQEGVKDRRIVKPNKVKDKNKKEADEMAVKVKKKGKKQEVLQVIKDIEDDTEELMDMHCSDEDKQEKDEDDNIEIEDQDIMDLMKGLNKQQQQDDYDSDESEDERVLKELLEKEHKRAEEEGGASDDDEEIDQSDLDFDFNTENSGKLSKNTEKTFKFGDSDKGEIKDSKRGVPQGSKFGKRRKTVVDDDFFSLHDMESFLDIEDKKEERDIAVDHGEIKEEEADSSGSELEEEEYGLLYEHLPTDEEQDEDSEEDELKNGKIRFADFFDVPVSEEQRPGDKERNSAKEENDHDEGNADEHSDSSMDDNEEPEDENEVKTKRDLLAASSDSDEGELASDILGGRKSTYEKRQEKLKNKIGEMESAAMSEKPWQLLGEVTSGVRPLNSLLEENLDFEQQTRAAPTITEETTKSLEDIIKQRIKDKCFDDVERKDKPKEEVFEYKKRIELNQEKSKLSLAQVYEQEYVKQQQDEEEEKEDPHKEEITKSMNALFLKLDALSNFYFTPKPAAPEVKIVNNLPSVVVEEVLPVGVSDATMLAPEEIKAKPKREEKGDSEKTKSDKVKERKDKKKRQKIRNERIEKRQELREKLAPGRTSKYSQEKALNDLKKQSKSKKGVSVIEDKKGKKTKNLTSSKQFFTQLQEEVTTHIHSKKTDKKKKKKEKGPSVASLKL